MSGGRGLVGGLGTRHPIAARLPGVYADDGLVQRWTAALDEVLAPVLCTLDNLPAYFDPALAPDDFVGYLAHWVGAVTTPAERRREAVTAAVRLHGVRGTAVGLAEQVRLVCGVDPEIEESGGAAWSATPGGTLPGSAVPRLVLRVRVPDPAAVDRRALAAVAAACCPAQLTPQIEIVAEDGTGGLVEAADGDL